MNPTKKTAETFKNDLEYFCLGEETILSLLECFEWMLNTIRRKTGQAILFEDKNVIGDNKKDVMYFCSFILSLAQFHTGKKKVRLHTEF